MRLGFSRELFVSLLYEEESARLDFKEGQYELAGASTHDKEELLKDILAFANAWRSDDAFILRGVREVKGGRSIATGVDHHLDDAQLQQFVNSKTQRPVDFSYLPFEYDGRQIGVIRVPVQERPVYLRRDFGRLKNGEVYVRRGSSTAVASPDEIVAMGSQFRLPFQPARDRRLLEEARKLGLHSSLLELSDEALSIVVNRPYAWEYKLLLCRIREKIDACSHLKVELQIGMPGRELRHVGDEEIIAWQRPKAVALERLVAALDVLISETVQEALGPPGESGDPRKINTAARKLGEVYERALQWGIDARSVSVSENSERLVLLFSQSCTGIVEALEEFADTLNRKIHHDERLPREKRKAGQEVVVKLSSLYPSELPKEIEKLERRLGGPGYTGPSGWRSGCLLGLIVFLLFWFF